MVIFSCFFVGLLYHLYSVPPVFSALVGTAINHDASDPQVRILSEVAVQQISLRNNGLFHSRLVRIESVKSQVVNGILYHLNIALGDTTCKKNRIEQKFVNAENCPFLSTGRFQRCSVTVWHRAYDNFTQVNFPPNCTDTTYGDVFVGDDMHSRFDSDSGEVGWSHFHAFVTTYGKTYNSTAEMMRRYDIFRANMKVVKLLQEKEQGTARYGATKFADMDANEFSKYFLTPVWPTTHPFKMREASTPDIALADLPDAWDWREHSAVTPVKDQGYCGSCWAFSVTGNIEGQWQIKKGELIFLSEQELVDCDDLDQGCNGGLPDTAYKAIIKLGGLEGESDYPYDARQETCQFKRNKVSVYINDSVAISQDEVEMAKWLYKNGPISIGINAFAMQFYFWGISHPWKMFCSPKNLDHGVLIVGFGKEGNKPFWIVKNSWGSSWGEGGYYRVYRGDGTCGLNLMATSAVVD